MKRKFGLEIGGERTPAYPEYDQFDNVEDFGANIIGDARYLSRYVPKAAYQHVYARNVLEHFTWRDTSWIIEEWLWAVKPGGHLEIVVPDALGIVNDYVSGKDSWEHCCERLAGTQDYPGNTHLAFFTFKEFHKLFPSYVDIQLEQTHVGGGITACVWK